MSLPRQIQPGSTDLLGRRTFARDFWLRPDPYVTQVFLYCLAYASATYGVLVHAFVVLSNHFHLVATDLNGVLPEFMQCLRRTPSQRIAHQHDSQRPDAGTNALAAPDIRVRSLSTTCWRTDSPTDRPPRCGGGLAAGRRRNAIAAQ